MLNAMEQQLQQAHKEVTCSSGDSFLIGASVDDDGSVNQPADTSCRRPSDAGMVAVGFSRLGETARGTHTAYLKLQISHTSLDNPAAVAHCHHLQELVLAHNCLTALQPLNQLKELTRVDFSHNRLTQVLDYCIQQGAPGDHTSVSSSSTASSNLRVADLSHNCITEIRDLSHHIRLSCLVLDSNSIRCIGRGLAQLQALRSLSLSDNMLSSCAGLESLGSLRELNLCGNCISTLEPLSGLSQLQALDVSHNRLSSLQGVQGLASLRQLDVSDNHLRRIELLAACSSLQLLTDVDVSGNPLKLAQDARLHIVRLLAQLRQLDGIEVSVVERVEANNMAGGATDGLMTIRHRYFPKGELEDGGGAVPPTAAGLLASCAEEELSCSDPGGMLQAMAQWAKSVHPALALQPVVAAAASGAGAASALRSRASADRLVAVAPSTAAAATGTAVTRPPRAPCVQPHGATISSHATHQGGSASRTGGNASRGGTAAGAAGERQVMVQPGDRHGRSNRPSSCGSSSSSSSSSSGGSRPVSTSSNRSTSSFVAEQRQWYGAGPHDLDTSGFLAAAPTPAAGGVAAIAARLAAGCCKNGPYRQLQLLQGCCSWVLAHVQLPKACDEEAGADLVTWDVGLHLFGEAESEQLLDEALLPGCSGTFAERVSQLLVSLAKACHLEAVQLSGFWKAGGRASVTPGQRLASHNHCWVAVKVNNRWRLLDPVYALIRAACDEPLPLFIPPEAFIHTHLPFEACWQLLPEPLRPNDWWQMPELSLAFAAAGGRLTTPAHLPGGDVAGGLQATNVLHVDGDGVVPSLRICMSLPSSPTQQRLCVSLWDSNKQQLLDSWDHCCCRGAACSNSGSGGSGSSSPTSSGAHQRKCGAGLSSIHSAGQHSGQPSAALVFQQQVLRGDPQEASWAGAEAVDNELWVAFPGLGQYTVQVDHITEVPGGLIQLRLEGLPQPWPITLRQRHQVLQVKVLVQQQLHGSTQDCGTEGASSPARAAVKVASLPQPCLALLAAGGAPTPSFQLLLPQPGTLLEADRPQLFHVLAPSAAAVAVGSHETGWVELTAQQSQGQVAPDCGTSTATNTDGLFVGEMVLPRVGSCCVAVRWQQPPASAASQHNQGEQQWRSMGSGSSDDGGSSPWVPLVALCVLAPVQDLVLLPGSASSAAAFTMQEVPSHTYQTACNLLASLDGKGVGHISRRDMLVAFRRDRQLADHLKMPARIRAGDGTFDSFLAKFIKINTSGLGCVDLQELCQYLTACAGVSNGGSNTSSRVPTATAPRSAGR